MKVLAFDISKKATGVAFCDEHGPDPDSLTTIAFENTTQWRTDIKELIEIWSPDVVAYSDTANKFNSLVVLRAMLGLFFYFEVIAFDAGVNVILLEDGTVKKWIGCNGKNRIEKKANTIKWVKEQFGLSPTEDECDAIAFGHYVFNNAK